MWLSAACPAHGHLLGGSTSPASGISPCLSSPPPRALWLPLVTQACAQLTSQGSRAGPGCLQGWAQGGPAGGRKRGVSVPPSSQAALGPAETKQGKPHPSPSRACAFSCEKPLIRMFSEQRNSGTLLSTSVSEGDFNLMLFRGLTVKCKIRGEKGRKSRRSCFQLPTDLVVLPAGTSVSAPQRRIRTPPAGPRLSSSKMNSPSCFTAPSEVHAMPPCPQTQGVCSEETSEQRCLEESVSGGCVGGLGWIPWS